MRRVDISIDEDNEKLTSSHCRASLERGLWID